MIQCLIELGADVNIMNSNMRSKPLDYAWLYKQYEIMLLLKTLGAHTVASSLCLSDSDEDNEISDTISSTSVTSLHKLIKSGNEKAITHLISTQTLDLNATNKYHKTSLFTAVEFGRTNIVEHLIAFGSDANVSVDLYDQTLLQVAIDLGRTDIVRILLVNGANPYVSYGNQDRKKLTPNHYAQEYKHTDIQCLLDQAINSKTLADETKYSLTSHQYGILSQSPGKSNFPTSRGLSAGTRDPVSEGDLWFPRTSRGT